MPSHRHTNQRIGNVEVQGGSRIDTEDELNDKFRSPTLSEM